jgi:hypothetical protein
MERDGNVLVAIIERQAEWARAPSRWDGTGRKRHRFFYPYCMYQVAIDHTVYMTPLFGSKMRILYTPLYERAEARV